MGSAKFSTAITQSMNMSTREKRELKKAFISHPVEHKLAAGSAFYQEMY